MIIRVDIKYKAQLKRLIITSIRVKADSKNLQLNKIQIINNKLNFKLSFLYSHYHDTHFINNPLIIINILHLDFIYFNQDSEVLDKYPCRSFIIF